MPVRSHRAAVEARLTQAIDDGLVAGGNVYRTAMQNRLIEGYTSGAFVSGMQGVAGSVAVSEPDGDEKGRRVIVGTSQRDVTGTVSYPLAWELGFTPARGVFSPGIGKNTQGPIQRQRVETWRPVLDAEASAIVEKFRAVVARLMEVK